jgi:hypothetical protein
MNESETHISKQERLANKVKVNLAMSVREIFERIEEEESNRPENMAYFDRIFETFEHGGEGTVVPRKGEKIIGTYCLFVPEELIYAAGARPVRLCSGAYESVEIGEEHMPEVACPMVKSEFGLSTLPILSFFQQCELVVMPASCDWKVKGRGTQRVCSGTYDGYAAGKGGGVIARLLAGGGKAAYQATGKSNGCPYYPPPPEEGHPDDPARPG